MTLQRKKGWADLVAKGLCHWYVQPLDAVGLNLSYGDVRSVRIALQGGPSSSDRWKSAADLLGLTCDELRFFADHPMVKEALGRRGDWGKSSPNLYHLLDQGEESEQGRSEQVCAGPTYDAPAVSGPVYHSILETSHAAIGYWSYEGERPFRSFRTLTVPHREISVGDLVSFQGVPYTVGVHTMTHGGRHGSEPIHDFILDPSAAGMGSKRLGLGTNRLLLLENGVTIDGAGYKIVGETHSTDGEIDFALESMNNV